MMATMMYLMLAIPPTWAATPIGRPGERWTPFTGRPGEEGRRDEDGRMGRAIEEGVGCQGEVTLGSDYSGTAHTTTGGHTCQAWSAQEPHEHGLSHYGDHNYCRNLDGYSIGLFCYTTDNDTRWEKCPVPICKAQITKILDFSLDSDHEPDSNGSYTSATLEKEDLPPSFTICGAHMVKAWTTEFTAGVLFMLKKDGKDSAWSFVYLYAAAGYTEYQVYLGGSTVIFASIPTLYFPLQWTRVCMSLDTDSAMVRLVVDGQMLGQEEYKAHEEEERPLNVFMLLGARSPSQEYSGQLANLNMFSSALSLERMVGLTTAGGEECRALGDYITWEEAEWTLHSAARMLEVEAIEGPCRDGSKVQVFTADFTYHHNCMNHCQKIGQTCIKT